MTGRDKDDKMSHAEERMDKAVLASKQSAKDAATVALDSIVISNAVSKAVHEMLDRLVARNKIYEDK